MPYAPTDWVNGATPLSEANMDKIETGIVNAMSTAESAQTLANNADASAVAAKIAADQAQATANNAKATADAAQPRIEKGLANGYPGLDPAGNLAFSSTQKIVWAGDTNVYRYPSGAALMTDQPFWCKQGIVSGLGLGATQLTMSTDGGFYWGADGVLKTYRTELSGSRLVVSGALISQGITCQPGVTGTPHGSRYVFNWTGSSYDAYVDNTFIVSIYSSDGRNKKVVKPLPSMWETVKELNPVSFRWKTHGIFKDDKKTHVGFVAQDLQGVLDAGVSVGPENDDGEAPLSLNLNAIVSALTKALQEAMERIEILEGAA